MWSRKKGMRSATYIRKIPLNILSWRQLYTLRGSVYLHTTRGGSKKTNIDPQSSLEKKSRQENLKVTKATKSLHFSITIFSSVAGQKRKAPFG